MDNLILVDIYDQKIGNGNKEEVHRMGKLHRAFSVFIYDHDSILIQRRALSKYHSGGLWANTCCSHPREGESTLEAANRRLYEEVGLKSHLNEIFSFVYFHKFHEQLYEYEYDHVIIGEYQGDKVMKNALEVEESKWIHFHELESDLIHRPEIFAVWFLIAAPKVMKVIKEKRK